MNNLMANTSEPKFTQPKRFSPVFISVPNCNKVSLLHSCCTAKVTPWSPTTRRRYLCLNISFLGSSSVFNQSF